MTASDFGDTSGEAIDFSARICDFSQSGRLSRRERRLIYFIFGHFATPAIFPRRHASAPSAAYRYYAVSIENGEQPAIRRRKELAK